ncbi:MAG: 4-hydroxybenzoyl-CoA thioesterase [Planctomycetaceae bacterium]|nr:4-hydroxybenzoyl-CoA thioesterase [Planctomycetaceae bacterium]
MAEPFRTSRMVEFHDTDMAGIMHFAAFFCYMESAEHELLRSLGLSINSMFDGHPVSFPRVAASCEYRSPAHCEEFLDIAVAVQRIGQRSVTYSFTFTHGERLVAEGQMTSVCCRMKPGHRPESTPIPADVAKQLSQFAA